ncbi:MAG: hypothetical protein BGP06_16420 [Rhizobiales bacterium 65-9]|nr:hypothetical protein [Hyphomicrobiales bacterium]OJY38045.1 MAG: hypothetical protein BGP06_16420 [Rhizobiales bacterium 65-9]
MNRIVREHYPASQLPADLREGIDPSAAVTVTVVQEGVEEPAMTLGEILAARRPPFRAQEDIDREFRALRDEWDNR